MNVRAHTDKEKLGNKNRVKISFLRGSKSNHMRPIQVLSYITSKIFLPGCYLYLKCTFVTDQIGHIGVWY